MRDDWHRYPSKPGETLMGLRRSFLQSLVKDGLVKSVTIRRPGSKRYCVLLSGKSIRAYINSNRKST